MKIFISSVVHGLEAERDAVASAVTFFGHEVLRSERLEATETPRRACLELVRQADVVVLILGERYGTTPPGSTISPTHEEYREARQQAKDVIALVAPSTSDERQRQFIDEVRAWSSGTVAQRYNSAQELRELVMRGLRTIELVRERGRAESSEVLARARAELAAGERAFWEREPRLGFAVAFGPRQQIVRPRVMSDPSFHHQLQRDALSWDSPVLSVDEPMEVRLQGKSLVLLQDHHMVLLAPDATIVLLKRESTLGDKELWPIAEEDVIEELAAGLRFASLVLDRIDSGGRLTDAAPVAAMAYGGLSSWLTRTSAREARKSGEYELNIFAPERVEVVLDPPLLRRHSVRADGRSIADDLTELIRRQMIR